MRFLPLDRLPVVRKCCCCLSLRFGCIFIGSVDLIGVVIAIVMMAIPEVDLLQHIVKLYGGRVGHVMTVVYPVSLGVTGLCSILLIVGAARRLSHFSIPWLVDSVLALVWLFVDFFFDLQRDESSYELILMPVLFLLWIYCLLIVFSHYRQSVQGTVFTSITQLTNNMEMEDARPK